MDIEGAIAESKANLGRPMSAERLDWFRRLTETGDGLRLVPAVMMRELVEEIIRLDEALDNWREEAKAAMDAAVPA